MLLRRVFVLPTVLFLGTAGALAGSSPAFAVTCDVTTLADTGAGSLRDAMESANEGGCDGVITITAEGVIEAESPLPTISRSVTISGTGTLTTTLRAHNSPFVIEALSAGQVSITDLSVYGSLGQPVGINLTDTAGVLERVSAIAFLYGVVVNSVETTFPFRAESLTVSDNQVGIQFTTNSDVELRAVTAERNATHGIDLMLAGRNVDIDGVVVSAGVDGATHGIFLNPRDGTITAHNVTVSGTDSGITIEDTLPGTVLLDNVTVTGTSEQAILIQAHNEGTVDITGAEIFDNEGVGIKSDLLGGSELILREVAIRDNKGGGVWGRSHPVHPAGERTLLWIDDSVIQANEATVGAGVRLESLTNAEVRITDSSIVENIADGDGGGIAVLGQEYADLAKLSIVDSVIADNLAGGNGAGIAVVDFARDHDSADGIPTHGIDIVRTTISGNRAANLSTGGGLWLYGYSHAIDGATGEPRPVLLIDSSTISGNTANTGGGIDLHRAADSGHLGMVQLVNSTVGGNGGGGISTTSDDREGLAMLLLSHSTVGWNGSNPFGAEGISAGRNAVVLLDHTIVADSALDLAGDGMVVGRWSLVETPSGEAGAALEADGMNRIGLDPQLGELADNGGPTQTLLPSDRSPAVDRGDPAFVDAPAFEQRGTARIIGRIDIGAVEQARGADPDPDPDQEPEPGNETETANLPATGADGAAAWIVLGLTTVLIGGLLVMLTPQRRREG